MTWEDDFMCVTQSAFSEMRLLVEGAIVVYEEDAGILCRLAREAEKFDTHGEFLHPMLPHIHGSIHPLVVSRAHFCPVHSSDCR